MSRVLRSPLTLLAVLSLLSVGAACLFGPWNIPWSQVLGILFSGGAGAEHGWATVVLDIRLPRVLLAYVCGGGLGLAGAVYQNVLRNPLADPFTLGVSSGAAFGASLCIAFGLGATMLAGGLEAASAGGATAPLLPRVVQDLAATFGPLPLTALAGGLGALVLALALGRMASGGGREGLVLAGIVVSTFLSACISFIKALDEESVASIVFWIMGSFQGRGWEHMGLLLPWTLAGLLLCLLFHRELDLLLLGGVQAGQMGVHTDRARLALLTGASLMTASGVAVAGVIGFVGLVVPHCVRRLGAARARTLLPASALGGGVLLVWADVAARMVIPGGVELPVGVVTALIGGPFFLFLLTRRGRS